MTSLSYCFKRLFWGISICPSGWHEVTGAAQYIVTVCFPHPGFRVLSKPWKYTLMRNSQILLIWYSIGSALYIPCLCHVSETSFSVETSLLIESVEVPPCSFSVSLRNILLLIILQSFCGTYLDLRKFEGFGLSNIWQATVSNKHQATWRSANKLKDI